MPTEQIQDGEVRSTFPMMYVSNTPVGESTMLNFESSQNTPSAANRWRGNDRGAYADPAYDRLIGEFARTLDPTQRQQQAGQLMKIFSEDEPAISLFFRTQAWAFVSALTGPQLVDPGAFIPWNIQNWEWH